jgi:putative ABC transport system permease protein
MPFIDTLWQDARRGARALGRTPGFAAAAILTLALGIGAVSAIFTVINAVLLRPLPYAEPERRVLIWSRWTSFDKTWLSAAEVMDYRTRCRTLDGVAAWGTGQANLTGDGEPLRVGVGQVTANAFDVLGAAPLIGRTFTPDEDRPGHDAVVVLSYGLWQRRYGGDASILGRTIQLDGGGRTVLGVMPPGFRLPTDFGEDAAEPTELWAPLAIDPKTIAEERGNHGLYAAARLKPGETPARASAELGAVTAALTREGLYPPAMQFSAFAVGLEDEIFGVVRPAVLLLGVAVAFLLLIACANVASLLLARAEGRQREMALRCALGAGEWRLVRQLLTESAVLALVSGALGLFLGVAGLRLLLAIDPTVVPRVDAIVLDWRVIAFTALVTIATTIFFSLVPALRAFRLNLGDSLKEGSHQQTVGAGRQRLRNVLVVAEVALAVVLVVGAVLMVRSLWALQRVDLGFNPDAVLTMRLRLPETSYEKPEQVVSFYQQMLSRIRTLPGVTHAGAVRSLPLANAIGDWGLDVEGFAEQPGQGAKGDWQIVSDGAAETLGERLVAGRFLAATDTLDSPLVGVINETMARTYWQGRSALGGRFKIGNPSRPWVTVVGIVGDVKHNGVEAIVKEKFYVPHTQWHRSVGSPIRNMTLVVKTAGDPMRLAAPAREAVRAIDPTLPVANIRSMNDVVGTSIATPRFTGWLLALFAGLALVLSAIGIYGVLAYLVSQRRHEIGIRVALGASTADVMRLVLSRGVALTLAGVAVGLLAAAFLTRFMQSQLRDVGPTDPSTFIGVPILLGLVALVASVLPARRATRVDPVTTLKDS